MFKIAGILIKDRVRRMKKTIECHKILMYFAVVGLISCIYTTSLQDILFLKKYLIYVTWISMLYLGLKIMNPTQEAIIDYQLIELKLITRRQFKLLIGMKLYGVGTIIAIINYCILKEKTIYIFCILNCAVNIYVFFRNSYRVHLLDLVMIIYVCASIYLDKIVLAAIILGVMTIAFVKLKIIRYEALLPIYRVIYRLNLRYSGQIFTDTGNDEIATDVERLFGGEKKKSTTWCQNFYESAYKFYWMKEISRIAYDKEGYMMRIMTALLLCISIFYLPEWYGMFAILGNILVAYDFCLTMYREDIKLYPFGFIDQYNFKTILITKLPVYSLASIIIMIPMIFVLKKYSWCILVLAVLTPLLGVMKSFFFLSSPGQRKVEFNKNLLRK